MAQDFRKGKPQALPVNTRPDMGGVNPLLLKKVYHKFAKTVMGNPCEKPTFLSQPGKPYRDISR